MTEYEKYLVSQKWPITNTTALLVYLYIESIIVDFWWTFLVLTFTFVFSRISDTIKHDIMKNNIPHFLHCTINCISHLVHYIMERSPAVFSFHPICSPQIDLSTPSNQCGINCMKPHLHTYTSPSPTPHPLNPTPPLPAYPHPHQTHGKLTRLTPMKWSRLTLE